MSGGGSCDRCAVVLGVMTHDHVLAWTGETVCCSCWRQDPVSGGLCTYQWSPTHLPEYAHPAHAPFRLLTVRGSLDRVDSVRVEDRIVAVVVAVVVDQVAVDDQQLARCTALLRTRGGRPLPVSVLINQRKEG